MADDFWSNIRVPPDNDDFWANIDKPQHELADQHGTLSTQGVPRIEDPPVDDSLLGMFTEEMSKWGEAIKSGWDDSTTGILAHGAAPDPTPDMANRHKFIKEFTHIAVDLPIDILGAIPGAVYGGPIGAVATSAGFSSGFRQWVVDQYGGGNVSRDDLVGRFMSTLKAAAGGAAGGVVGGKVGGVVAGKISPMVGSKVGSWLSSPFELAAMSTTQSLIQNGELPSVTDFKDAAIGMIAGKSVGHITGKIQDEHFRAKLNAKTHMEAKLAHIWAQTGVHPHVVSKMAQRDPHLMNQLMDAKMVVPDALLHADPSDIMSKVDDGSRVSPGIKETATKVKNATVDAMVDDTAPIKRAFNKLAGSDQAWDRASALINPYKRAALARGWSGKYKHLLDKGGWDLKTGQLDGSKGIMEILHAVDDPDAGTSLTGFAKYMTSGSALEREANFAKQRQEYRSSMRDLKRHAAAYKDGNLSRQDHKDLIRIKEQMKSLTKDYEKLRTKRDTNAHTGMKQFDNEATMRDLDAKYAKHAEEFQKFNKSLLTQLKDAGILSEADLSNILKDHQAYVPFARLMDDLKSLGASNGGKPKEFKGSGRPIRNPFEVYLDSIQKDIRGIEYNTVLQSLRAWDPDGIYIKRMPLDDDQSAIKQVATEKGIPESEVRAYDLMERVQANGEGKSIIIGYENGKRVSYEVDADMARAFTNLTGRGYKLIDTNNPVAKAMWGILKKPSDILRFGATTTPEFMAANLLRDTTASFAFSRYGGANMFGWAMGAAEMLTKGKSDSYWEMMRSGGEVMGQHRENTSPHLDRDVYAELMNQKRPNVISLETLNGIKDKIADATEGGSRMWEYMQARQNGQHPLEAAFQHRDITLDFARAGYIGRYINDIVTFHNAGVQSLAKLHKVMTTGTPGQRLRALTGITLGVTVPSMVLNWAFGDDERYKKLEQWERDLYWCLPIGPYMLRIPKPHEIGVVFGSSVERAMDSMRGDQHAWDDFAKNVMSKMIPGGLGGPADFISSITAFRPIIEAATNHNFFRDTQIVPDYFETLPADLQFSNTTSDTARAISGAIGNLGIDASPMVIDNSIKAWTGGAGQYVISLLDTLLEDETVRPGRGELKVGKWGWDEWSELPIVRAFLIKNPAITGRARALEQFRTRHEQALKEANAVDFLKDNFMFGDLRDRLDKRMWIKNQGSADAIQTCYKAIRKINSLPSGINGMTDRELADYKVNMIERLNVRMVLAAEQGLKIYNNIDKRLKENDGL